MEGKEQSSFCLPVRLAQGLPLSSVASGRWCEGTNPWQGTWGHGVSPCLTFILFFIKLQVPDLL